MPEKPPRQRVRPAEKPTADRGCANVCACVCACAEEGAVCLRVHASVYTVEIQNGARAGGEPVAHFTTSAVARPPTQGWAVAVTSGQDLSLRTSCLSERPGVVAARWAAGIVEVREARVTGSGPKHGV